MATLSQLLTDPTLGLRLVQSAPEDPQLSWVSTTELLQLADYLEGGELVLTTGVSLSADDSRWRDFVAGLSRARGAGWRGWATGWTSGGAGAGRASGARPAFSAAAVGGAGKLLGGTGQ